MNPEDVYAEEAQEQILDDETRHAHERDTSKSSNQITVSEGEAEDEDRPLLSGSEALGRPGSGRRGRGYSYERALNEPWTGSYHAGDRPWYKKPSVSSRWRPIAMRLCCTNLCSSCIGYCQHFSLSVLRLVVFSCRRPI